MIVKQVAGCSPQYTIDSRKQDAIEMIRRVVGSKKVSSHPLHTYSISSQNFSNKWPIVNSKTHLDRLPASQVLVLVSGGVDSLVCAALVYLAIPDPSRVIALHVDHGFMRLNESAQVRLKNKTNKLTALWIEDFCS